MSQSLFGGIVFALEQAAARDDARNENDGNIIQKFSAPPQFLAPSMEDGDKDDQSGSNDEKCEAHFIGEDLEQLLNFEDVGDDFIADGARSSESDNNAPPKMEEEKMEMQVMEVEVGPSELCARATEFVPASITTASKIQQKMAKDETAKTNTPTKKKSKRRSNRMPGRRRRRRAEELRMKQEAIQSSKMDGDRAFVPDSWDGAPTDKDDKTSPQRLDTCVLVGDDEVSVEHINRLLPWRKCIPEGSVDPISLELLVENAYPPFVLVVDEPYTPIYPGMWPPNNSTDNGNEDDTNEDRELAILKQQWGDLAEEKKFDKNTAPLSGRKFNLFDGHILANYLVSTQQFIDPYNRRDLTRGELEALDDYLAKHNLSFAGVCLAFDNRATISTAGTRAQSAAGRAEARAEILRRNADSILNQMFTIRKSKVGASTKKKKGKSRDSTSGAEKIKMIDRDVMNSLQQTEALREDNRSEFNDRQALEANLRLHSPDETGVYGAECDGLLIIDDDINPGLRGAVQVDNQASQQFPSLATTKVDRSNTTSHKWGSQKSMHKVCATAIMTDQKLAEKQHREREAEEQRRARELQGQKNYALETTTMELIRNNKTKIISISVPAALAKTGWRRPVSGTADTNPAKYESSLLARATILMAELVKLEKQLIRFLADDTQPSLSLKPMASNHKLVHDYCQYWKLLTEGSDATSNITKSGVFRDPKKIIYIDCKKLDNTCAPCPLLSDAAKHPVLGVAFKKKKKGKKKIFELAFASV